MKCREVFLSADAHVDFKTGREFYDRNSTKAGDYFVASVLSDLESLSFYAGIHPLFNGYYRMLSRRFPFAVYYEIHEEQVWVVAILDMRSKPDGIIEKLKKSLFSNKVSDNVSDYVSAVRLAQQHQVILIGGPNGAGKSTTAPDILQGAFRVDEFVNADTIAHGLSAFRPEKAAIKAGRVMLTRLHELALQKMNFAFETTLSSRSFAPWLTGLKQTGYRFSIMYFWLESPQLAVGRVAERVLNGGHNVPKDVIIRRYEAGLSNFFRVYQPVADHWRFYDNSNAFAPVLIATGEENLPATVLVPQIWNSLKEKYL